MKSARFGAHCSHKKKDAPSGKSVERQDKNQSRPNSSPKACPRAAAAFIAVMIAFLTPLSLGKGILYADLQFKKSSNDLVLVTGTSEQIIFKNWYASTTCHSVANLQVVIEGTADYNAASSSAINDNKIERFNFDGLVTAFDQALAATPTLTSWGLSSSLLAYHLGGVILQPSAAISRISTVRLVTFRPCR